MSLSLLPTGLSLLFRGVTLIFLRIIPAPPLLLALPALFSAYLASVWFAPPISEPVVAVKEKSQNGGPVPPQQNFAPSALQTIVFSLPTKSKPLGITNLVINTLLLLFSIEFVAYPFIDTQQNATFTRVGAVHSEGAKIVARYPNTTAQLVWRESIPTANTPAEWTMGPVFELEEANDWVSTVGVDGLYPSTSYEYRLASPTTHTLLPYPAHPISFKTFPDPRLTTGTHLRFIASSCILPNFPYVPFHGNTIKGFDLLAKYLDAPPIVENATEVVNSTTPNAEFMLFLGDFIYADVPVKQAQMSAERYRTLYRRNYASPSFRKVYERLPILNIYDDHEIQNNYHAPAPSEIPLNDTNATQTVFEKANSAYTLYNHAPNHDPRVPGDNYYDFKYGDVAFFVLDTRRYRSAGGVAHEDDPPTILGERQLLAFNKWLARVNTTTSFKFVVSSVPLTSLWTLDAQVDSWAGYKEEKRSVLETLHSVSNVIVLSGDRHEFAGVEINAGVEVEATGNVTDVNEKEGERQWKGTNKIYEFSTSPLSMFYIPFFRTLKTQSAELVRTFSANGTEEVVPKERVFKAIATGNHKWSDIEVDTRNLTRPTVLVSIAVDGVKSYSIEIIGTPVTLQAATSLGAYVPGGIKELLGKIGLGGLQQVKWF